MGRFIWLGAFLLMAACHSLPEESREVLEEARSEARSGRPEQALERLDGLPRQTPTSRLLRGQILLDSGRGDEARPLFFGVLGSSASGDAERCAAATALGTMGLEAGEFSRASRRFEAALDWGLSSEARDRARVGLVRSALARGDRDEARRWLGRLESDSNARALAEQLGLKRPIPKARKPRPPRRRRQKRLPRQVARPSSATIQGRSEWGAAPAIRSRLVAMRGLRYITIHHTGEQDDDGRALSRGRVAARIRSYQAGHQKSWADIGYHFLIDRSGRVWEGRELRWQGAHGGNGPANQNNVGIALIGNCSLHHPPKAQVAGLESLLRWLVRDKGIAPSSILGHNAVRKNHGLGGTDCPGRYLRPEVARLRMRLAAELAASESSSGTGAQGLGFVAPRGGRQRKIRGNQPSLSGS